MTKQYYRERSDGTIEIVRHNGNSSSPLESEWTIIREETDEDHFFDGFMYAVISVACVVGFFHLLHAVLSWGAK